MSEQGAIFIGSANGIRQKLLLSRANRHGIIAGATGTGKTVTLQGLVEGFSQAGIPVFAADVKGDLAGLAMAGSAAAKTHNRFADRAAEIGYDEWQYRHVPVQLWDFFGEQGHPVRTTVSEMGPLLLARLMGLNEVQEGVLTVAFHAADTDGLLLLDLDDLQAMLADVAERADEFTIRYGNVSKASVGAIQRSLLQLRSQGGDFFFGEPALDIADLFAMSEGGEGVVNILAADKLMASPRLYSTFLLWLMSELFEQLPEVGDLEKPKLVFFFDEAHLLFDNAPPVLLEKIEQVVRLIRSKGVGVFFITQNPADIPEGVAAQLSNRIQHALRAFTSKDQRAIRAAAETFRTNPGLDVETAITELKVGEALVSFLQADGSPAQVERSLIKPPGSRVGTLTAVERDVLIKTDAIAAKYDIAVDRESAEEILAAKASQAQAAAVEAIAENARSRAEDAAAKEREKQRKIDERLASQEAKEQERARNAAERDAAKQAREAARPSMSDKLVQSVARSAASSVGRQIGGRLGSQILRGILGGIFRGK